MDSLSPKELKNRFRKTLQKAADLTCQQLSTAKHLAESESRSITTAVTLRRHAWLRSAALQQDIKDKIEGLPFDGKGLFSEETDPTMKKMKKSKFTTKTFMASASASTSYGGKQRSFYRPRPAYRQQDRRDYRKSYQPYNKRTVREISI